jgi:hypothetical protein
MDMDKPKKVVVTLSERSFYLDLPLDDEKLMACVFFCLRQYVKKVSTLKINLFLTFNLFSGGTP